jgi:hypothetical protein
LGYMQGRNGADSFSLELPINIEIDIWIY